MADFISTYGLYVAYILGAIAILLVIILPIINSINDPKSLLGTVVGIVIIGVIFFIGWSISDGNVTAFDVNHGITTEASSKFIGGALITMYILGGLAILSIVYSEIANIFR